MFKVPQTVLSKNETQFVNPHHFFFGKHFSAFVGSLCLTCLGSSSMARHLTDTTEAAFCHNDWARRTDARWCKWRVAAGWNEGRDGRWGCLETYAFGPFVVNYLRWFKIMYVYYYMILYDFMPVSHFWYSYLDPPNYLEKLSNVPQYTHYCGTSTFLVGYLEGLSTCKHVDLANNTIGICRDML